MQLDYRKFLAKAGYAAHGIVYFIVGGLAVADALGQDGDVKNTKSALLSVLDSGFGRILLCVIGVGLFCYAGWRLFQSLADADEHGSGVKAVAVRAGQLVSGAVHAVLGVWALFAALSAGTVNGSGSKSDLAAWLIQQPYGLWLIGFVGLCIIGTGSAHIFQGATKRFRKWFDVDAQKFKVIDPVATTGLIARGTVFVISGCLFIYAALTIDPQKAGGVRDALLWLRQLPFGTVFFFLVAVGLVSFGAYNSLEALYRQINTSPGKSKVA